MTGWADCTPGLLGQQPFWNCQLLQAQVQDLTTPAWMSTAYVLLLEPSTSIFETMVFSTPYRRAGLSG